ncbi:hypothetical protein [Polaromonas sp. JS666]|uniref:hypothetical protein n=1 Tax=Polaromonas sp. (strain JS666 / ATCC BAA-500) TaxID=296591 RepID=UPI0000533767|nr:hypothetical protein [Polaromonas sp. JS666]ABE46902.1 hypothetical protein Bpro_5030 [Polaromonas sp. JS666]
MLEKFNSVALGVPAQQYYVRCHVSVERQVPVMTEFAVRLIHLAEKIEFEVFREYFGLAGHDANELVEVLKSEGLVQDFEGVLSLTTYALARFVASHDGVPRFTKIVERQSHPVFNLLTFSPLKRARNGGYWDNTLELNWEAAENGSAHTLDQASEAFHRHFHDIERLDKDDEDKRAYSVYKIEEISSGKRFNVPIPMDFYIDFDGSIDYQLEDNSLLPDDLKSKLTQLTADRVGKMVAHPDFFPEFPAVFDDTVLRRYMREVTQSGASKVGTMSLKPSVHNKFLFSTYVKEVHAEGNGEIYDTGKSQAVLGALYMPKNLQKLLMGLEKALRHFLNTKEPETPFPVEMFWVIPESELWGRTEMMKEAVFAVSKLIEKEWGEPIDIVAVCNAAQSDRRDSLLSKARLLLSAGFNDVLLGPSPVMSARFELLILPGVHVAAMYQWKSPASDFLSVPIGFISEHKNKLAKSLVFLRKVCSSKLYRAFWGNADDGDGNRLMLNDVLASEFLYLDAFAEVEG